ncbi:glycosyltransferase family 2 protein [Oceanobacillus jeddahense]|uniref:Glycosyltransferase family 2 protein n=1 Tax=Oceanobacillus jeddahense TaxID=1462527 RepID=A0ABY5K037_9BACI|nr:glycosyltransferase family A protein [Oceanobacillus jeddahense]UUI05022.1 glycosyltransferase family 2 protein [Oceanobacillus jeddahense]
MKDITALLVFYSDATAIRKALQSLKRIDDRLHAVIVLQEQGKPLTGAINEMPSKQMQYITWNDPGKTLNDIIQKINSTYVLFLHDTDYLSPAIQANSLHLSQSEPFLTTNFYSRNIAVHRPFLVSTSFLKKQPFLLNSQLPFKEALLPAWLFDKSTSQKLCKEDLVLQSKRNNSANILEKQTFMHKYQLKKIQTANPSLSVVLSNYNMEQYAETAVVSCLLQNTLPEQVLIMDDGSTDNSYYRLKQWDDGKLVRVFEKENEGKAIALNRLLPYVTSDFILELDADDWLDPDAISVMKKLLAVLSEDTAVLYGNLRKWKQLAGDVLYKGVAKGKPVNGRAGLLSYHFPLGPRIYRTSVLKEAGGFPVMTFKDGKLYEDVSVLSQLIKHNRFQYHDFTVYNVREHKKSITKTHRADWDAFLKSLQ